MTAIEVFLGVLAAFFVRDLLARLLDRGAWHMELPRANVGNDDEVDPVNLTDEQRKLAWEEMKRDDQAARRRGAH